MADDNRANRHNAFTSKIARQKAWKEEQARKNGSFLNRLFG
jgi:hypothetical protein